MKSQYIFKITVFQHVNALVFSQIGPTSLGLCIEPLIVSKYASFKAHLFCSIF